MYIKVKVKTGARREVVSKLSEDKFEISVKEKPINNEANRRIIFLISSHLGVKESNVRIVKGSRSPSKIVLIK